MRVDSTHSRADDATAKCNLDRSILHAEHEFAALAKQREHTREHRFQLIDYVFRHSGMHTNVCWFSKNFQKNKKTKKKNKTKQQKTAGELSHMFLSKQRSGNHLHWKLRWISIPAQHFTFYVNYHLLSPLVAYSLNAPNSKFREIEKKTTTNSVLLFSTFCRWWKYSVNDENDFVTNRSIDRCNVNFDHFSK